MISLCKTTGYKLTALQNMSIEENAQTLINKNVSTNSNTPVSNHFKNLEKKTPSVNI